MRGLLMLTGFTLVTLWSAPALPCGGGFGDGLAIGPLQKIVVVHKNGIETYIFNPSFCGEAAEFGLILPIPSALSANPELAAKALFDQLGELSAPIYENRVECGDPNGGTFDAGTWGGGDGGGGVQVIDAGQVGIFDWVLLQAQSSSEFTTWLDTNGFPYDPSATAHFNHYVAKSWHFVAFRVTADQSAPPAGTQLCGDLGPLSLSFPATQAVIPARIAAAGANAYVAFNWEVYSLADTQLRTTAVGVSGELRFSGALSAADLSAHPLVAQLSAAGDRLTKLQLMFAPGDIQDDIVLVPDPNQQDYRHRIFVTTYIDCEITDGGGDGGGDAGGDAGSSGIGNRGGCGGCSSASQHSVPAPLVVLMLLALAILRRRRR